MSQTTAGRARGEAEDEIPPVPRQQVPQLPEDDVPELPDEQLPAVTEHDIPKPPDPEVPPAEPQPDGVETPTAPARQAR